ncbi:MAG TPA: glycosyltransferase family 4 protein [Candidatus Acidoferrales bacterium]|nr:glycosyltransferase family 4 protein [Candidatus Acidoferrales bacterium]
MAACTARRREGGAAAIRLELARQLEHLGHSVDILFEEDVIPSRFLPKRFHELDFSLGVARHILRNSTQYDVVHLRAPAGCVYGFAKRFARNAPPYVVELDGLEERRAYAIRQEMRKGRGWDSKFKNRLWHRFYHMPRFRVAVKTADWIVCSNREIWSYLQLVYGLNYEKMTRVPHGVEMRFIRERDYPPVQSPKLLYVGTWLEQRGIRYLGQAFSQIVRSLPGAHLTIVGCGLDRGEVLRWIPADAQQSVNVIPFVPSAEMPEVYAAHDIFVFPSFFEGLPLSLLEAMAGGMPVITTETCGMMDVVTDDWNGILIRPGDSQAIVDAVLRLTASADLRKFLGTNAHESAVSYSWEKVTSRLLSVLENVLRQTRQDKSHNTEQLKP